MKVIISSVIVLLISSCSGYQRSESIADKIKRFTARENIRQYSPEITPISYNFSNKFSSKRQLSSFYDENGKDNRFSNFHNKRIYFLTLLSQYYKLKTYAQLDAPEINYCPQFHSAKTSFDGELNKILNQKQSLKYPKLSKKDFENKRILEFYPELVLSLSSDSKHPTVFDTANTEGKYPQKLIGQAFSIHLSHMYKELQFLCENGHSNNYYAFTNLITYINNNKSFKKNNKSLKALFKTTLFSNMAIFNSLDFTQKASRSIASKEHYSIFEMETIRRTKANWISDYFHIFKLKKKQFQSQH